MSIVGMTRNALLSEKNTIYEYEEYDIRRISRNGYCTPVTSTIDQQVAFIEMGKGVKNRDEYEAFLHDQDKVHAGKERENGKVSSSPKLHKNEDSFVRELCRGILLDVVTHCVRKSEGSSKKSVKAVECQEECERGVKNDNGR